MIVALGGDDPNLPGWAELAAACGAEAIPVVPTAAFAGTTPQLPVALQSPVANASLADASRPPDAAILGGSARSVLAAARSVGEHTPLLILPAAHDAPAIAYGLAPHVEDGRVVLPGWSHRAAPAVAEYLQQFTSGRLGDVSLVRLERSVRPAQAGNAGLTTPAQVDEQFFQDVDLLRLVGGDYNRITAVAVGSSPDGLRQMSVTLAAAGMADAHWSLLPGETDSWRLTITGTRANAELHGTADAGPFLRFADADVAVAGADARTSLVREFLAAVSRSPVRASVGADAAFDPRRAGWEDYLRAADLLQGMHRSLRRRRTIDLHFESTSERSQFKTQMTAVGCGVLTWALLGVCLGLLAGRLLDPRDGAERRAAAAGTIVLRSEFDPGGTTLPRGTLERLERQVALSGAETIILIERDGDETATALDSDRLQALADTLRASEGGTLIPQIELRPLSGQWFRWMMLAIWCAAFTPLAVFLALQGLIALTRTHRA